LKRPGTSIQIPNLSTRRQKAEHDIEDPTRLKRTRASTKMGRSRLLPGKSMHWHIRISRDSSYGIPGLKGDRLTIVGSGGRSDERWMLIWLSREHGTCMITKVDFRLAFRHEERVK